jgi:hypothetical protein
MSARRNGTYVTALGDRQGDRQTRIVRSHVFRLVCISPSRSGISLSPTSVSCHTTKWILSLLLTICPSGCLPWLRFFLFTLTGIFPSFFLSCKTNARVKLAKTGHGPHSSRLVLICVVLLLFVLFCLLPYVLFVCKCVLYCCHRVTPNCS